VGSSLLRRAAGTGAGRAWRRRTPRRGDGPRDDVLDERADQATGGSRAGRGAEQVHRALRPAGTSRGRTPPPSAGERASSTRGSARAENSVWAMVSIASRCRGSAVTIDSNDSSHDSPARGSAARIATALRAWTADRDHRYRSVGCARRARPRAAGSERPARTRPARSSSRRCHRPRPTRGPWPATARSGVLAPPDGRPPGRRAYAGCEPLRVEDGDRADRLSGAEGGG